MPIIFFYIATHNDRPYPMVEKKVLNEFIAFIELYHLDNFVTEELNIFSTLDIPLMKLLRPTMSEEALRERLTESARKLFQSFRQGRAIDMAAETLRKWEADDLPGLSKVDIQPTDLVYVYGAQKKAMLRFLPDYTGDTRLAVKIADELSSYYLKVQKLAFEVLFQIRKENEEKITILRDELKAQVKQLEEANSEMDAFTYSVSHDLRSPLRAINGYAQILKEDYEENLDEEGRRILSIIQDNASLMGQLIDDLLTFSRIGRREINKRQIDMSELVKSALKGVGESVKHSAHVVMAPLPSASADPTLMPLVWINLISNAVKYSSQKKNPRIEISALQENNEQVYVVKDNGAGFDMQYYNKLFDVFSRLHDHEEFEGTGVGLAIVKKIISLHGGRIWAEAKTGKGATFYFSLPV